MITHSWSLTEETKYVCILVDFCCFASPSFVALHSISLEKGHLSV